MPRHFSKGNAFGGFRVADNLAGIVVGDETLRNDVEKRNRNQKQHAANCQRQAAILQSNLQGPAISPDQPIIAALGSLPELSVAGRFRKRRRVVLWLALPMLVMSKCFQNTTAKHRRKT